jgi:hypothetical protein
MKIAQFIGLCSSLKPLIKGWKHFCRVLIKYAYNIELYILILSIGNYLVALEKH